jgi:hypothetical protein
MRVTKVAALVVGALAAIPGRAAAQPTDQPASPTSATEPEAADSVKGVAPPNEVLPPSPVTAPVVPPQPASPPARNAKPISPATTTSVPAPGGTGLLVLPYVGINLPVGKGSDNHSIGRRLGLLLGWNANPKVSLNAELSLDVLDGNGYTLTTKPDEKYLGVAASPLFRIDRRRVVAVFGPTVGYFQYTLWLHESYAGNPSSSKQTARGVSVGLNVGVFVPLGPVAVGGMFAADLHQATRNCKSSSVVGGEYCDRDTHRDTGTLGLSGAVMF